MRSASPPMPPGSRMPPACASIEMRQTWASGRSTPANARSARHRAAHASVPSAYRASRAARTPSRACARVDATPGSHRSSAHSAASMRTSPLERCSTHPASRPRHGDIRRRGARGSQHRSRTGTTHATNASAATASAHGTAPRRRGRVTAHGVGARARASAGHSPRSVRITPSSYPTRGANPSRRRALAMSKQMGSVITSSFS